MAYKPYNEPKMHKALFDKNMNRPQSGAPS